MQERRELRYRPDQQPTRRAHAQEVQEATLGQEQPRRRPDAQARASVPQPRRRGVTGRRLARTLFSREALREAILLHEILDQPVSLRNREHP